MNCIRTAKIARKVKKNSGQNLFLVKVSWFPIMNEVGIAAIYIISIELNPTKKTIINANRINHRKIL